MVKPQRQTANRGLRGQPERAFYGLAEPIPQLPRPVAKGQAESLYIGMASPKLGFDVR
jgi:hypothetical protein